MQKSTIARCSKVGFKKDEPIKSGTSADDAAEFVRRKARKDMNEIEGDDSVEEGEDSNEVDEENMPNQMTLSALILTVEMMKKKTTRQRQERKNI